MNQEIELDQTGHAGGQASALLSAALAAAQTAAQTAAERARRRAAAQTELARAAERQAERMSQTGRAAAERAQAVDRRNQEQRARTEEAVRHRQWGLKPTSEWLHDNPLSAAAAWANADVHRGDPIAARHAEQWETVFKKEDIDLDEVRANAEAAVAEAEQRQQAEAPARQETGPDLAGDAVTAAVIGGAVVAGAADIADALDHDGDAGSESASAAAAATTGSAIDADGPETSQPSTGREQWTAYADGAAVAALGGRGVSTPPGEVLAAASKAPDIAASAADAAGPAIQPGQQPGIER